VSISFTKTSILSFAKILLVAITLFSIEPQLGSLDADGDGYPEVPILVLNPSSVANPLRALAKDQLISIIAVTVPLFPAVPPDYLGNIGRELLSQLRSSTLHSFVPLRR